MNLIAKPVLRHITALGLTLAVIFCAPIKALASGCIAWSKVMTEPASIWPVDANAKNVTVLPFENFFHNADDDWMVLGLRDYVSDLLRTSKGLRITPAGSAKATSGAAFVISGIFQIQEGRARIFLRLADEGGRLLSQQEANAPYPNNQEFFTQTAAGIKTFMEQFMKVSPNMTRFSALSRATGSTEAYKNFSKGRQILSLWQPDKVEQARKFFEETKRIDYQSPLGYEGMIALDAFHGFVKKQRKQSFLAEFQRAEAEDRRMKQISAIAVQVFGASPSWKEKDPLKIVNRFVAGNIAFIEGMQADSVGNAEAARAALQKSVTIVPEDAQGWLALSRVEQQLGNQQGMQDAVQKALAIDSCAEQ